MIHEYRTYTIHPHLFARYCDLAEKKAIPIRRDNYGCLVAFWISESGTLCQVHHIWEYPGLDARNSERARMFANKSWTDEFIAEAWPTMQRQEVRFMHARTPATSPPGSNIYETRIYRTVDGRFVEAAEAVNRRPRGADAHLYLRQPGTERSGRNRRLSRRYGTFRRSYRNGGQQAWLGTHGKELVDIRSTALLPLHISPMK